MPPKKAASLRVLEVTRAAGEKQSRQRASTAASTSTPTQEGAQPAPDLAMLLAEMRRMGERQEAFQTRVEATILSLQQENAGLRERARQETVDPVQALTLRHEQPQPSRSAAPQETNGLAHPLSLRHESPRTSTSAASLIYDLTGKKKKMGRKKTAPKQMGDEQRQQMQWNMLDGAAGTDHQPAAAGPLPRSLVIISDDDPALERERMAAEQEMEWEESSLGGDVGQRSSSHSSSLKKFQTPTEGPERDESASLKAAATVPEETQRFFRLERVKKELNELVGEADIIVPAYGKNHLRTEQVKCEWHWEVGRFTVKLVDRVDGHVSTRCLSHFQECWLYFTVFDRSKDFVYFEVYDECTEKQSKKKIAEERKRNRPRMHRLGKPRELIEDHLGLFWRISMDVDDPWSLLERLSRRGQKKFHLEFGDVDITRNQVEITLYGRKDSLDVLRHQEFFEKDSNLILQELMKTFYNLGPPDYNTERTRTYHDFHELFEDIKEVQQSQQIMLDINVQHSSLKPRLRPYQEDAVLWMLKRERYCEEDTKNCADDLHTMYTTVTTGCGKTLYYNRYGGSLLAEKPQQIISPPGGILADEMGLGKTVEVLCCMLLHPRTNVPLPERLPTLIEYLEAEEEDNSLEEFSSSSVTVNSTPSLEAKPINREDSSSVISFEATEDHSYKKYAPSQGGATQTVDVHVSAPSFFQNEDINGTTEPRPEFEIPFSDSSCSAHANTVCAASEADKELRPPMNDTKFIKSKEPDFPTQAGEAPTVEAMERPSNHDGDSVTDGATESTKSLQNGSSIETGNADQAVMVDLPSEAFPEGLRSAEAEARDENVPRASLKIDAQKRMSSEEGAGDAHTQSEIFSLASTSSASGDTEALDSTAVSEQPEQTALSPEEMTGDVEMSSSTKSGSQPRRRKRRFAYQRKRTKTTNSYGGASEKRKEERRRSAESQDTDDSSSMESASQKKRAKSVQLSNNVQYATEEEYQDFMAPDPVLIPQKQLFECVCGKDGMETEGWMRIRSHRRKKKMHMVTCVECKSAQHAECLNYDLEDPFRGQYKCPHCHYQGDPIPSGATLIVSPASISHQWLEEIKKHVRESSIKVFVYKGVSHLGYVQPQTLASQDIVITTYETLRRELNYVDLPHTNSDTGRRLRNPKKFMALPTPLIAVEWWRICLDEAQMVECVTTKTAEMALRLSCVNRWCATGTPLNHSVDDLFGLLAFIGFDPYCVDMWWKTLLLRPYLHFVKTPLVEALSQVMWRTAMKDVQDQLGLPGQTEEIYHLTFSPVEKIFYQRLFRSCTDQFNWAAGHFLAGVKGSTTLSHLGQALVAKFYSPLTKLRQACCHPQAVKGSFIAVQESMLTMDQLLDNLIKKTVTECMKSHRDVIAAMNGQAGIYLIEQPPRVTEAVVMYRSVLMSVEEHQRKNQFKTDALPHLHTLHNLKEVLDAKPTGVGPTLRDDLLGKQCEELKEKYMQRARAAVVEAREQLAPYQQAVQELAHQLTSVGNDWYVAVLSHAALSGNASELMRKVEEDLMRKIEKLDSFKVVKNSFRNVAGLQYIIETELADLHQSRSVLMKEMKKIGKINLTDRAILEKFITCCRRPTEINNLKDCIFCKLNNLFLELECKLFNLAVEERTVIGVTFSHRNGTWQDSELEIRLKAVLSFARSHHLERDISQAGTFHIRLFDAWKKEFKLLRLLWANLREEMAAVDELGMAVTRMRLRLPGEAAPRQFDFNVRETAELPSLLKTFAIDQRVNAGELRAKCGTLEYLKNLAKGKQGEFQDGINPDQCPICKDPLGRNWSVLQCGHCFCMDCIGVLVNSSRAHHSVFKCACCREKMTPKDISYVSTARSEADNFSLSVKGSHSTKVAAVVQCIINIKREEPKAKVLVFATWIDVLKLISNALEENEITYTNLYDHGNKFEKNVTQFKENPLITALLMPYHTGSKGLNLFEANHVLLVEPILNPAQEAQAIGRVYRMGQTKPTKIHRFLIKQTIEERIHLLMDSVLRPACKRKDSANDLLTIDHLISLFQDCQQKKPDDSGLHEDEAAVDSEAGGSGDGIEDSRGLGGTSSQDGSGSMSLNNGQGIASQDLNGLFSSIGRSPLSSSSSVPSTSLSDTTSGSIAGPSGISSGIMAGAGSSSCNSDELGSRPDDMPGSSTME